MSLLAQNLLFLVPFILMMLFMVHAMVQFTLSLMTKWPRPIRHPANIAELRKLLSALSLPDQEFEMVESDDQYLELRWEPVDMEWRSRFARVWLSTVYRARILLDESHRQVRLQEHMRTGRFFLGFDGWIPRVQFYWSAFWGPLSGDWSGQAYGILPGFPPQIGEVTSFHLNTMGMKQEITRIANSKGWAVRPVVFGYQVSGRWQRRLEAITPGPLQRLSDRRFWGIVYPASYLLGFAYFFAIAGEEIWTPSNLIIVLGISAVWWSIWGFLAWLLRGAPRRQRPKRGR